MKSSKKTVSLTFLIVILSCINSTVFGDSIAIKDNQIFIADKGLTAKNLLTGQSNQCLIPPLLDPSGNDVTNLLSTATDVVIKRNLAVVTTHPTNDQGNTTTDTVIVDVSKCLDKKNIPVKECISTVDMEKGVLTIPCVKFNDNYLTVNMDRRGNSSNWEVTFLKDNTTMTGYKPEDDESDDDSDDSDSQNKATKR
ncbi:hypothetical protein W03_13910 [Nitrosomonas sp. PY1]|uniref:hypothetical protein n=1 Tax=Nitrosomonas sp. PY1 TaxID=1803906 RepID=UPI001FC83E2A|nr:hypothetical protein [Nitrosomonas sp. PY1]GKS69387.1 hypothetical protein W03_13910 [Nitrosomonas sp. PY1]